MSFGDDLKQTEANAQAKLKAFENKQVSWIETNWKGIAIGVSAVLALLFALKGMGVF